MPRPKTTRRLRDVALRALLGIWALFVTIGAAYGFAGKSAHNHLTHALHENLNEGKNNYDSIKVSLGDGLPFSGLVGYLVDHWLVIAVVVMAAYIVHLHRSHKKARVAAAPAAPHGTTAP